MSEFQVLSNRPASSWVSEYSKEVLFISYKFVKRFLAITFFITCLFRTETYILYVNVSYVVRNEISAGSDERQGISQYMPIVKIVYFGNVMYIDMTLPKWAIFTTGVYGEISHFLPILLKFRFWLDKKTLTHTMKVSVRNNK